MKWKWNETCSSIRDFCRGLWDKKSPLLDIAYLSRRWLVQIICNIKDMALKKSKKVVSWQRKHYQNGVPGLFLEFLIVLTVSLILVFQVLALKQYKIANYICYHFDALFELWRIMNVWMLRACNFNEREDIFLSLGQFSAKKSI